MRTYSIVFLDIDGTLLDSRHQVMPCTLNRLKYLSGRNVPIILCSARPPGGVNLVTKQIGLRSPVACYNGGLIYDENSAILRDVGINTQLRKMQWHLVTTMWISICSNTADWGSLWEMPQGR